MSRLESIPDTNRCIDHSNEGAYVGFPLYSHKTAPEVVKVKPNLEEKDGGEAVRQLVRGYMRGR